MSSSLLNMLKVVLRDLPHVRLAYIYGSQVKRKVGLLSDLDIAILAESGIPSYYIIGQVKEAVSKRIGLSEDRIDVLLLNKAPPHLLYEVLKNGIKIVDKENWKKSLMEKASELIEEREFSLGIIRELVSTSGINPEVIRSRLDVLMKYVSLLKSKVLSERVETIESDEVLQVILERCLQVSVEAIVDTLKHAVVSLNLGLPETYKECIERALSGKLITQLLASNLHDLIRVRHTIVHGYIGLDYEELYSIAKKLVKEVYPSFLESAKNLLEKSLVPPY